MTTLAEISKLINNKSPEEMLQISDQYTKFVDNLEDVGSELLEDMDRESLIAAVTLIQAYTTARMIEDGEMSINNLQFLMSRPFAQVVINIMKLSIGLSVVEEIS